MIDHTSREAHLAFAKRLAAWIERAGVTDGEVIGDLAIGFADTIAATATAAPMLEALLELDPLTPDGAYAALAKLGYLHALLITEAKHHLEDLERQWEALEVPLALRAPDDDTESEPGRVSNER